LTAVFLPSFLLVIGALPFWEALRGHHAIQASLRGVNAGVVGLLLAALYDPIWTTAIRSGSDFGLALAAFALLVFWRVSPVIVVAFAAIGGWFLASDFSLTSVF
jgi:chromate transporter